MELYDMIYPFANVLYIYAIYLFAHGLFGKWNQNRHLEIGTYAAYYVCSMGVYLIFDLPLLNLACNLLFLTILSFGYAQKIRTKILFVAFTMAYLLITDLIYAFCWQVSVVQQCTALFCSLQQTELGNFRYL